jgi:hypothetical protein
MQLTYISAGTCIYDYLRVKTKDHFCAFPLTYTEVNNLYQLNYDISEDDEFIINSDQIKVEELLTPDEFSTTVDELVKMIDRNNSNDTNYLNEPNFLVDLEDKIKLIDELKNEFKFIASFNLFFDLSIINKSLSKLIQEEILKAKELLINYETYSYNKLKYKVEVDYDKFTDDLVIELFRIQEKNQKNAFSYVYKRLPKREKILSLVKSKLDLNKLDELTILNNVIRYEMSFLECKGQLQEYFERIHYEGFDFENFNRSLHILEFIENSLNLFNSSSY